MYHANIVILFLAKNCMEASMFNSDCVSSSLLKTLSYVPLRLFVSSLIWSKACCNLFEAVFQSPVFQIDICRADFSCALFMETPHSTSSLTNLAYMALL